MTVKPSLARRASYWFVWRGQNLRWPRFAAHSEPSKTPTQPFSRLTFACRALTGGSCSTTDTSAATSDSCGAISEPSDDPSGGCRALSENSEAISEDFGAPSDNLVAVLEGLGAVLDDLDAILEPARPHHLNKIASIRPVTAEIVPVQREPDTSSPSMRHMNGVQSAISGTALANAVCHWRRF